VFDRRLNGEELTLGVSGKLIMNNLVMFDRQTRSYWLQFTGESIDGAHKGRQLAQVPHVQTTWEAWLNEHPDTLVLDKRGGFRTDPYSSYYRDGSAGVLGESRSDDRFERKDLVVGYISGSSAKGYPIPVLTGSPVINDVFRDEELLIVYHEPSETAQIFLRTVDGRSLSFEHIETTTNDVLMRDVETGTTWSGVSGRALDGPMAGETLQPVPSFYAFWFAWNDFFLEGELYEASD
jgi:hypothetical protein